MTIPARTILFVFALAALAVPATATITYVSCSTCSITNGTYAIWQTAPGSAGLTFSMSPATFAAGNLSNGIYTDGTGTVFTGYLNATNVDTAMSVSGTALVESVAGGNGSGIEIQVPPNTYAIAMQLTTFAGSSFTNAAVELGDHLVNNSNYGVLISSGGSVQFFGIISSTPLPTTLFFGPITGGGGRLQVNDFEIGQATATPEASTVALIGSGLVLLGLLRRRSVHKPDRTVA